MSNRQRFVRVIVFLSFLTALLPFAQPTSAANLFADDSAFKAQELLQKLTPEERVGQVFLVTFKGRSVDNKSQIYDLIFNHHIGGVVLKAANDNFTGPTDTVSEAYRLISALQTTEWQTSQIVSTNPDTKASYTPAFIPLFVGVSQEGDQYPNDQILSGLTPLPNEMAIGATWNPAMAEKVGEVMGNELSTLGINVLIGPSLDVLDVPQAEGGEDLGVRTFGGDPFWVGEMGKAYIKGLHVGSGGSMMVVSKNFPGRGGSDRPPEEEVATVRKSLEQLKQIELAPFFAVTGNAPDPESTTDGLLVSHIRYQGFQGNIRATTRPVSFDKSALELILNLPEFSTWRKNGGVIISDDLGSQAVRKFYDPTGTNFDARQVARDAFLAGNDVLYMDNFVATGDPDNYTTIIRVLDFFARRYRDDPAFAQRIDESVLRLLTLKFRLNPNFTLESVIPSAGNLAKVGQNTQVAFDVARSSASLISPDVADLRSVMPRPPEDTDRIVFVTDTQTTRQCSLCPDQTEMAADALESAVLRLYGPRGGGQIAQSRLSSYTFSDLRKMLDGTAGVDSKPIENDLSLAGWIIFSVQDVKSSRPDSMALRNFLSQRPDILRNKRIIVFSFNAPYYLDATDISKLTAYYGMYSKAAPFIDVAARILFQEVIPSGNSPVSIPGVGYDMIVVTSPDPVQIIPLMVDVPEAKPSATATKTTITPLPTTVPRFKVGDTLPLRTGEIVDHNQNTVPDGTVVRFQFTVSVSDTGTVQQIEATTINGVAHASYRISTPGLLEIRVVSDPANKSQILRLDIQAGESAAVTAIAPTSIPTNTATPTPTNTPSPTPTPTPTPPAPPRARGGEWLLAMLMVWSASAGVYFLGQRVATMRWGVRWALLTAAGGIFAYIYIMIGMPGGYNWTEEAGFAGILLASFLGALVGWGGGWVWKIQMDRRAQARSRKISGPG